MDIEEFQQKIEDNYYYSSVVGKLAEELVQNEEIYSVFCESKESSSGLERCYYVVTKGRFFKIYVNDTSFGYKSCPLRLLNGFEERIIPRSRIDDFVNSAYFLNGKEGVSSYVVRFSFDALEDELKEIEFSVSESWLNGGLRLKELRCFVRGFHKAVACL